MSTPETDSASKGSRDAPDAAPDAPDGSRDASNAGPNEGRSTRKRRAILEAATEVFLRKGYVGTSMDEIVARAAVSKQTVYKHFADKESLFAEIVTSAVNEVSDPNYEEVVNLEFSGDVESDLRGLASRQLARVMQPRLLQLRRLVIGEAGRFPELGRVYYERGPGRTIDALAGAFERLAERDLLQLDDPHLAAAHFNWLVMSIPLNEAMLCGDDDLPGAADLDRYSETGVRAFLAAYGAG
jgi:TetR/AcrR family transcriptional regulator, mexJK operon transcriptional repressor